jgi:hypothetical protein
MVELLCAAFLSCIEGIHHKNGSAFERYFAADQNALTFLLNFSKVPISTTLPFQLI